MNTGFLHIERQLVILYKLVRSLDGNSADHTTAVEISHVYVALAWVCHTSGMGARNEQVAIVV